MLSPHAQACAGAARAYIHHCSTHPFEQIAFSIAVTLLALCALLFQYLSER